MATSNEHTQLHVLVFPWLAHGHIAPYMELSRRLALKGVKITFFSTTININKLKSKHEPSSFNNNLHFLHLPLPSVDGLPEGVENTAELPDFNLMPRLKAATDLLEEPFHNILERTKPDLVIFDIIQYWVPRTAGNLGIPTVLFTPISAAANGYLFRTGHCVLEDYTRPPRGYPSSAVTWRMPEARATICRPQDEPRDGVRTKNSMDGCRAILVKSCHQIEGKFLDYLETMGPNMVFPVGPLLAPGVADLTAEGERVLKWMDGRDRDSVVYVCFGSEYPLTEQEVRKIAEGLEMSGLAFIWALRLPSNDEKQGKERAMDLMPKGFEERICDRGLVVAGWVPQQRILGHGSCGVFMTHCGWSSVMEGLSSGVPMACLGLIADGALNSRLVCYELGVGVEVGKRDDGSFCRDDVCQALKKAMGCGEVRRRAKEVSEVFSKEVLCPGGAQDACIERLIEFVGDVSPRAHLEPHEQKLSSIL